LGRACGAIRGVVALKPATGSISNVPAKGSCQGQELANQLAGAVTARSLIQTGGPKLLDGMRLSHVGASYRAGIIGVRHADFFTKFPRLSLAGGNAAMLSHGTGGPASCAGATVEALRTLNPFTGAKRYRRHIQAKKQKLASSLTGRKDKNPFDRGMIS